MPFIPLDLVRRMKKMMQKTSNAESQSSTVLKMNDRHKL